MQEVKSYFEVVNALEQLKVLVYRPLKCKPIFLKKVSEDKITVFNENMHYNISFEDIKELMKEYKIFILDSEDIEIETKF